MGINRVERDKNVFGVLKKLYKQKETVAKKSSGIMWFGQETVKEIYGRTFTTR